MNHQSATFRILTYAKLLIFAEADGSSDKSNCVLYYIQL